MTNAEMIEKVSVLIGSTDIDVDKLELQLEIIKQKVKNYCNRDDIPEALALIIVDIASKSYENLSTEGKKLESVKRGDTELRYASSEKTVTSIFDDYLSLLKPFVISDGSSKVRFL